MAPCISTAALNHFDSKATRRSMQTSWTHGIPFWTLQTYTDSEQWR